MPTTLTGIVSKRRESISNDAFFSLYAPKYLSSLSQLFSNNVLLTFAADEREKKRERERERERTILKRSAMMR
jgi:hypothetical protein